MSYCTPSDFHKAHFTMTYCEFLLSESATIEDYLREKGLYSATATTAYALSHGLNYDPLAVPCSTWEDAFIALLHQAISSDKSDKDFSRKELLWLLGGLVVGKGGSEEGVRTLYRQLNDPVLHSSVTGIRVLVRDAAVHVELPELPNDKPGGYDGNAEWPYC